MEKLGLLAMPLMAVSLLASCNNGGDNPGPTPGTTYTIIFDCTNCKALDENKKEITSAEIIISEPYTTYNKFYLDGDSGYKKPLESLIKVEKTNKNEEVDFEYNPLTGEIEIPIIDNLTVTASGINKTLEECTWAEINEISTTGRANEFFNICDTKKVQLKHQDLDKDGKIDDNEVYQTVRIIGFNEDYTELPIGGGTPDPSNAIGITFEFADLLSDADGYSLATQWNDTNTTEGSNYNYLDSSVRAALVGKKQKEGHILWAQKGATEWSNKESGPYTDKSVLDMLPDELTKKDILKTPAKYININDGGWKEEIVKDKLFLLSPVEMGRTEHTAEEADTTTYSYYEGAEDADRIKRQINGTDKYTSSIYISSGEGQTFQDNVRNYAGFNSMVDKTGGGYSWLRSPDTGDSDGAWRVGHVGGLNNDIVYDVAFAVAPAFCI